MSLFREPTGNTRALSMHAKKELQTSIAWIERQALKIMHAATLKRFRNQIYCYDDYISVVEAFNKGLLDAHSLLSPHLATLARECINTAQLTSWHEATHVAKLQLGSNDTPPGSIPLERIMRNAAHEGNIEILQWLIDLKDPTETIGWTPEDLLLHNLDTALWATSHPELLKTGDPHALVFNSIKPGILIPSSWLAFVDGSKILEPGALLLMRTIEDHIKNLMCLYFKDMSWQERWATFVDMQCPTSPVEPSMTKYGMQGLLQGTIFISGVLHNAPLNVQKCLAAFKNSRHPEENTDALSDSDPKAIRHAFFGGPAPQGSVSAPLNAWLSMMQGTPKQEAGAAWVQWQSSSYAINDDMHAVLPSGAFENGGTP